MSYVAKTNWQLNDTVLPADMNRIEQGVKDLDNRYLSTDTIIYVATTGSDTTGNGSSTTPYRTIRKALSVIPGNLNGFSPIVSIAGGTYAESVNVANYINGSIQLQLSGNITINDFTVKNAFVIVNTSGSVYSINVAWISALSKGILNSWSMVNWQITSYKVSYGRNVSIAIDASSTVYASGTTTLSGNTDLGVIASNNSTAYFVRIQGTGFATGFNTWGGAQIDYAVNGLSATTMHVTDNGGLIVKSSGAVVGVLQYNTNYYVSTTGSDTTGEGTSASPFRTIQHAIDILPKDLGGYTASIIVADGTYNEDISINGFSGGLLIVRSWSSPSALNTLCRIKKITVTNCGASMQFYGIYFTQTDDIALNVTGCNRVFVQYCQAIEPAATSTAFYFGYSTVRLNGCKSANHKSCVTSYLGEIRSEHWASGSTAIEYGLVIGGGKLAMFGLQPSGANGIEDVTNGGVVASSFGAKIGTLGKDINLYVATTGSDTTGDGTSAKPFKTIQYALSIIPKDLGGYTAYIYVADGTYDEGVIVSNFYNGVIGIIKQTNPLSISTNCSVRWIGMRYCSCRVYLLGLNLFGNGSAGACVGVDCTDIIAHFLSVTSTDLTNIGFSFDACRARVENCKVINHNVALRSYNSNCGSANWTNDSTGNNTGLLSEFNSIIITTGVQPQAPLAYQQSSGGAFIYESGTQITDMISYGLACTWGTITGGYIRHGNMNSRSMITIQIAVTLTTALSASSNYIITGVPTPSAYSVSVTHNHNSAIGDCYVDGGTNQIRINTMSGLAIGTIIVLTCTYMTNS